MPIIVVKTSVIPIGVNSPNEIGDTIGGILGPTVGFIAAALTFLAFWAQFDANIEQRKQFDKELENERISNAEQKEVAEREQNRQKAEFEESQRQFALTQKLQQDQIILQDKRARINLFESRFHAMLSIHRENATKVSVNDVVGQKTFIHLLDELSFIFKLANWISRTKLKDEKITEEGVYNVAYLSFFFGVGEKSSAMVEDLLTGSLLHLAKELHSAIEKSKYDAESWKHGEISVHTDEGWLVWTKVYGLGTGHLRRLSHYVRHLFQTVKFVHEQPDDLIEPDDKYNYIANLRAQLTVHEQILLYCNAMSVLGKPWLETKEDENFIEKYCMIKSVPPNALSFYKNPKEVFPDKNKRGKVMFEWLEIQERIKNLI